MSKGDILIVVNLADKKAIEEAIKGTKPLVEEVGNMCQFSLDGVEVDPSKNLKLSGLQEALDKLGEDEYACCVTVDRLETLDTFGSLKKFGLVNIMSLSGYTVTNH